MILMKFHLTLIETYNKIYLLYWNNKVSLKATYVYQAKEKFNRRSSLGAKNESLPYPGDIADKSDTL